jgi:opine dehydrogenase
VARVLEALDRERVAVAAVLGIRATMALDWLQRAYDAQGSDLLDAIHSNPGYYDISAPASLEHRYISDNVPLNMVPMAMLGRQYGVPVCTMEAVIDLACIVRHTDYWHTGRTPGRLGLSAFSIDALMTCVMKTGFPPGI